MSADLDQAIATLLRGGIVIYPTDTAFGIGCRMDMPESVKRLFAIRNRPQTQATSVLVSSIEMAKKYLAPLPTRVEQLMQTHWPGGLTVVYTAQDEAVPELVRGGSHTLGVRMPNHPLALALIQGVGVPLLGPSANLHGKSTPYNFADLDPALTHLVDYVLPGQCTIKQASTVIDCTQDPWKILRQGSVVVSQ